jgi:hypothetical protein
MSPSVEQLTEIDAPQWERILIDIVGRCSTKTPDVNVERNLVSTQRYAIDD